MNRVRTIILIFSILSFTLNVNAQEDYDFYLQKARQRLAEGDCTRAEASYNTYKDMAHKTNKEIERLIVECKSGAVTSLGQDFTETAYDLNMRMIYVEGGSFTMGCTSEQGGDCDGDESPTRSTTVSSFYIGMLEVTQSQWEKVMGTTIYQQRYKANPEWPMRGTGADYPMYFISWEEAQEFCQRLSFRTGKTYRLPTEAEWEYASRGGKKAEGKKYSGSNYVDGVAWYYDNSNNSAHPCGTKQANAIGVYDMTGNVTEWCEDRYGKYLLYDTDNPKGASTGQYRVSRGGSWADIDRFCRVSRRVGSPSYARLSKCGFRIVLVP